jgi:hypothetical protein
MKTVGLADKSSLVVLGGSNGLLVYAHIDQSKSTLIAAGEGEELTLQSLSLRQLRRKESSPRSPSNTNDIFTPLYHSESTTITSIASITVSSRTGIPATLIAVADSDGLVSLWLTRHGRFDEMPEFQSIRKLSMFGGSGHATAAGATEHIHMLSFLAHDKIDLLIGTSSRLIMTRLQASPRYAFHAWVDMDRSSAPARYSVDHTQPPAIIIWKIAQDKSIDQDPPLPACRLHRFDWSEEKYRSVSARLTQVLKG